MWSVASANYTSPSPTSTVPPPTWVPLPSRVRQSTFRWEQAGFLQLEFAHPSGSRAVRTAWDQGRFDGLLRGKQIAPRQTFAGYQTGPGEGSVADAMSEPLRLTIFYEDAGDGECWGLHASR